MGSQFVSCNLYKNERDINMTQTQFVIENKFEKKNTSFTQTTTSNLSYRGNPHIRQNNINQLVEGNQQQILNKKKEEYNKKIEEQNEREKKEEELKLELSKREEENKKKRRIKYI